MQTTKVIPIVVLFGVFVLLTQTVQPTSGLTCLKCSSRYDYGCTALKYLVKEQPCSEGQVCAKFITAFTRRGPQGSTLHFPGVIRDCVKYDTNLGPLNACIRLEGGTHPEERCLCNDTDFCNASSPVNSITEPYLHILLIMSCLFLQIVLK